MKMSPSFAFVSQSRTQLIFRRPVIVKRAVFGSKGGYNKAQHNILVVKRFVIGQ